MYIRDIHPLLRVGIVSGTHPQLEGDEIFSCARSARPLEGSAERDFAVGVSLWKEAGRSSVE